MQRSLAAVTALQLVACSYITQHVPDDPHASCPTSKVPEGVDIGLAIPSALTIVAGGVALDNQDVGGIAAVAMIGGVIGTAGFLLSAHHGSHVRAECREEHAAALGASLGGGDDACAAALGRIVSGDLFDAQLPSDCSIADLHGDDHADQLGRSQVALQVRTSGDLQYWHDGTSIVAVERDDPRLPDDWADQLGYPAITVTLDGGAKEQAYPDRGVAIVVRGDHVARVLVFPPTTLSDYRDRLASPR